MNKCPGTKSEGSEMFGNGCGCGRQQHLLKLHDKGNCSSSWVPVDDALLVDSPRWRGSMLIEIAATLW